MSTLSRTVAAVLAVSVVAAACSDDTASEQSADEVTTTTSEITTTTAPAPGLESGTIVFSGQGNDLVAYDADGNRRLVIENAGDDPENGRDINAQICWLDDRTFIAGEDTGQPDIVPGWGIFTLEGDTLDALTATQIGKLVPTYQPADSQPEMFGCGVLPDGRVVVTDIGNQAVGDGTGQLMMWFPPIEGTDLPVCKIDIAVGTAQQIAIDGDDVLVASARGDTTGVQRYTDLPTSIDECTTTDPTGAPMIDGPPNRTLFISPAGTDLGITNGIVTTPDGGWYVSSVFTGYIAEFDADGTFIRNVLTPPDGAALGPEPIPTGTPNGLAVDADGSLWYADLGIVARDGSIGPGDGLGTVRIIRFDETGRPRPPETIDDGLAFPDALGTLP